MTREEAEAQAKALIIEVVETLQALPDGIGEVHSEALLRNALLAAYQKGLADGEAPDHNAREIAYMMGGGR